MFYCEPCRVVEAWPKGICKSFGNCEICRSHRVCYDVPSGSLPYASEPKRITLAPLDDGAFKLADLTGVHQLKVVRVISVGDRRVVLEYGKGDIANPDTDPIIIGTLHIGNDYVVRVLWDSRLWRVWDRDTDEFMEIMEGVRPGDGEALEKKLCSIPSPQRLAS